MSDESFELEYTTNRTDLADLFAEFADALERGRTVRLRTAEETLSIDVPDRVSVELEAERDDDPPTPTAGLEFELEWEDDDRSSIRLAPESEDGPDDGGRDRDPSAGEAATDPGLATMPVEGIAPSSRRGSGPSGTAGWRGRRTRPS